MILSLKNIIPWWLKIVAKIALSRLPVQYKMWREIHLFQHGYMDSTRYAYSVFTKHYQLANAPRHFTCLELGPGDTLFSALIARALGAEKTLLVDVGDFAGRDMGLYRRMYAFLLKEGHRFKIDLTNLEDMLHSCRAVYLTSGLSSLRKISDESIDIIFSQAVFEHIRRSEFLPTLKELHRILKPKGSSSHEIDLRDHLGGSLNNLRFSDLIWESDFFTKSGFYTNRIRFAEMLALFEKTGFQFQVVDKQSWPHMPVTRNKLHTKFRKSSEQDLCVVGFTVILTR